MQNHIQSISFTQENTKSKLNEDWLCADRANGVFAVADGVSRSRVNGVYPALSAVHAAARFCDRTTSALAKISVSVEREESFYNAFLYANLAIAECNHAYGITADTVDYLHNDYLACVGIAGRFNYFYPQRFEYGYLGDCGLFVYDKDYFPKFLSQDLIGVLEKFRGEWGFQTKDEESIFWRMKLRNRPGSSHMSYGALTGELAALSYLKTGYVDLCPGDVGILFSDGIYPFLFNREFRARIANGLNKHGSAINIHEDLIEYINFISPDMERRGIGNLDDDKTFIALTCYDD